MGCRVSHRDLTHFSSVTTWETNRKEKVFIFYVSRIFYMVSTIDFFPIQTETKVPPYVLFTSGIWYFLL